MGEAEQRRDHRSSEHVAGDGLGDGRKDAEVARAKLVDDVHMGAYVAPGRTTLSEW
jgi:hypothetical protein